MLKISNLYKSFGDKRVLNSFSHDFSDGGVTLITGASGAGKTTLLRIIAGLDISDSGEVDVGENAVISFMFQDARLLPWKTVYDNIALVLKKKDRARISILLNELGLSDEANSMPYELSGGMQRRVALARALLYPADIYLLDEPFAGLDSNSAATAADLIFRYTKGKTVVIVSHDADMLPSDIETVSI